MIFVDTNVFMYAVGREHPLRGEARSFFADTLDRDTPLCTSAEVLQEFLHVYVPVDRLETLDAALTLADSRTRRIWSVDREDIELARVLIGTYPGLEARDLLHLACCRRREADGAKTFDRAFAAAVDGDQNR